MLKLIVVSRMWGPTDIADDRDQADRYAEIKSQTLPYCHVLITQGLNVRQAPLGAVRSQADGDQLCAALATAFPKFKFTTTTILGSSSEEAVFVPHGIGAKRIARSAEECQRKPNFRMDGSLAESR